MHDYFRRYLNVFVFGNFFIAFCAVAMTFTTFLLSGLPLQITPFTVFLFSSTYILYNFHYHSFKINYSGKKELIKSLYKIELKPFEKFFYLIAIIAMFISLLFFHPRIYPYLLPLALLALSYSIPLIKSGRKKIRLLEVFFIKTPILALVWALTTTIIPLVEQNISLFSALVLWQVFSRTLFIFALCIPFEMRDLEKDQRDNVRTLVVVHGIRTTKIIGILIIALEIVTHHFMPAISFYSIVALDISSLFALYFIIRQHKTSGPLYYKFFVDGTMVVRFIFLYIAIYLL